MNRAKYFYLICYLVVLAMFSGCSTKMVIGARTDLKTDISLEMDVGSAVEKTIASIMGLDAQNPELPVSQDALKDSFNGSDFTNVNVRMTSLRDISISGTLAEPAKQRKDNSVAASSLVNCTNSKLTLTLSAQTLQKLIQEMPQDNRNYLDLLMAPVFTGESMTQDEYTSLIAAIYGNDVANDIKAASVDITLKVPSGKKLKTSSLCGRKAKTTGTQASFSIPLAEFLTMSNGEQAYTINW